MSIRLKCRECRTAFLTTDDQVGRSVSCPKCGIEQDVPSTVIVEGPEASAESVFVPSAESSPRRRRRPLAVFLALLLVAATVAGVVAWPRLREWWHPVPPDPIEVAATSYLDALTRDDHEAARKQSTVEDPPGIRSFRDVGHDPTRDRTLRGSFRPIAAFHARVDEKFEYDPGIGRYKVRNALGPAAETLDALHEAQEKAKKSDLYKKMESGKPDDLFDAAEQLGQTYASIAQGVLAPKKLVPTYKQLVLDAKPPLPPVERELALEFARDQATWDALLKRPFPTLKADGPFIVDHAEVSALVTDKLGSSGDPPIRLDLKLMRFRLEGIDTGWKVISARRQGAPEPPAPVEPETPEQPAPKSSRG